MMLLWGLFTAGFIIGVGMTLFLFRGVLFSAQTQEIEENPVLSEALDPAPQLH